MQTRHTIIDTVIGELTVVADDDNLIGVYFPQHWTNPAREAFGPLVEVSDDPLLDAARVQLTEYLDGERTLFDLPTAAVGNAFRHRCGPCWPRSRSAKPPPTANWPSD